MPATAARMGFIKQQYRHAVAQTPAVKARHGNLARESEVPVETFFDNVADALTVANVRQALLSPERRRFRCATIDIGEILGISAAGAVPVARYVDPERQFNAKALVCEIYFDFDKQQAAISVWG